MPELGSTPVRAAPNFIRKSRWRYADATARILSQNGTFFTTALPSRERRKFGVLVPIDYSSFTATRHQPQIRIHYLCEAGLSFGKSSAQYMACTACSKRPNR